MTSVPRSLGLLRNRVARRILLLFIACALVPTAALSVIAYRHVSAQLLEQADLRLRQSSKTAGMDILQRLQGMRAELDRASAMLQRGSTDNTQWRPLEHGIAGIGRTGNGRFQLDVGQMAPPPSIPPDQARHVAGGGTALLVDTVGSVSRILLLRRLDPATDSAGFIWAEIAPVSLFGSDGAGGSAMEDQQLCVFDADLRPLVCPRPIPLDAVRQAASGRAGVFPWSNRTGEFLGGYFALFLGFEYGAPSWAIVMSEARRDVLAPLAGFRRSFIIVVLLALATVFMLSHVQIRRSMTPLDELTRATRRVAAQDFSQPAVVSARDEFGQLADDFNAMADQLQAQFSALRAMHEFDRAALNANDMEGVAAAVLAAVHGTIGGVHAALAVADTAGRGAWRVMPLGRATAEWHRVVLPVAAQARLHQASGPLHVSLDDEAFASLLSAGGSSGQAVILPLRHEREVMAALLLDNLERGMGEGRLRAARQLGDQVALALSRTHVLKDLEDLNRGTLTALARAIDANSPWTAGHSERVSAVAQVIGRMQGLDRDDLARLARGGLLHDVGKIGVSPDILNKPGALTPEEYALVKSHTTLGAGILAPVRAYDDLLPLVRSHHELLDGSGYPDGLAGDQIPPLVRIMTVADVFDALVSDRPYREALSVVRAVAILRQDAGTKFDATVVEAFLRTLGSGDAELWQVYPQLAAQFSAWPNAERAALEVWS